jgi:hypothetical protein
MVVFGIVGAGVLIYTLLNFRAAFYLSIVLGFSVYFIGRFLGQAAPSALIVDLFIHVGFVALLLHKLVRKEEMLQGLYHPITLAYLVFTIFLLIQVFNPAMYSFAGWFLVFRKFIEFLLIFFTAFHVFSDLSRITQFFKFWIIIAGFSGFYGVWQEWVGFTDFELRWIYTTEHVFTVGGPRKFSLFAGPAEFGVTMAATAAMTLALALFQTSRVKIAALVGISSIMLMGMAYSGTRTAYVVIVASSMLIICMTITRVRTLVFALVFLFSFAFILVAPIYGNPTINRIRTAFEFSDDASLNVRDINRQKIQPYIRSHPIGGGMATSGVQGEMFNPGHPLAGFPPDSGFLRTAIEAGWIGLGLQVLIYFIILQSGIKAYFTLKNSRAKTYALAGLVAQFTFVLAQYSQVSIGQIPDCFLFYSLLAVSVRLQTLKDSEWIPANT